MPKAEERDYNDYELPNAPSPSQRGAHRTSSTAPVKRPYGVRNGLCTASVRCPHGVLIVSVRCPFGACRTYGADEGLSKFSDKISFNRTGNVRPCVFGASGLRRQVDSMAPAPLAITPPQAKMQIRASLHGWPLLGLGYLTLPEAFKMKEARHLESKKRGAPASSAEGLAKRHDGDVAAPAPADPAGGVATPNRPSLLRSTAHHPQATHMNSDMHFQRELRRVRRNTHQTSAHCHCHTRANSAP